MIGGYPWDFGLVLIAGAGNIFSCLKALNILRGGAVWSARRAHNPKVIGSNPVPATKHSAGQNDRSSGLLFCLPCGKPCFWVEFLKKEFFDPYSYFLHITKNYFRAACTTTVVGLVLSNDGIHLFLEFVKRPSSCPDSHCCYGFPEIVFTHVAHDSQLLFRP